MEDAVRAILKALGEDPGREGLRDTPQRVADSLGELTRGYRESLAEITERGVFEDTTRSMVLVRDIPFYSLCEHHMLPFFGKAHVAYIPEGRIIGLSKIPRIVDHFSRRLQVQERLGDEIARTLEEVVQPAGVGVILQATHLCMVMRGVQKEGSLAVTFSLRGAFLADPAIRSDFVSMAGTPAP